MKVLICPLNWGLGHATRCVPLIRQYISNGDAVTIAADGLPLRFLKEQFPSLRYIDLPSYPVRYSKGKSQTGAIVRMFPGLIRGVFREHRWLKKLRMEEKFDLIVSDNRFGLWHKGVHSIYITHQLMIKMPPALKVLEPVAWAIHALFINRYTECLIPDYKGPSNLSGDLSHKYPVFSKYKFAGPLSRFNDQSYAPAGKAYDVVCLISGPEPQRTLFANEMIRQFSESDQETLIVEGLPGNKKETKIIKNLKIVPHLNDENMAAILLSAHQIICRSGYSTIMDLHALNCLPKAVFIPTPGQTEQEYLHIYHLHKNTNKTTQTIDLK